MKEELLDLLSELEKHPATFLRTWIEIRGEIEKLRLIVAAFDGGEYSENDMAEHSAIISLSVRGHLEAEQMMDKLITVRQTLLN